MCAPPPSARRQPELRGEVVLVVVERGQRRRLLARDLHEQLELQLLLALVGGEHAPAAAEERVAGAVALGGEAEPREQLEAALRPRVAPGEHVVGRAEPHDLALVEHLHPRRVLGGLVAKHPAAAGVDDDAAGRQRPARRDGRIDRVAGGRHEHQLAHASGGSSSPRGGRRARPEPSPAPRRPRRRRRCPRGAGTSAGSRSSRACGAGSAAGSSSGWGPSAAEIVGDQGVDALADRLEDGAASVESRARRLPPAARARAARRGTAA